MKRLPIIERGKNNHRQKTETTSSAKSQNQSQVAKKLSISVPAHSKLETGITDINLSRLLQIATLHEVPPTSLLPGEDINIHHDDTVAQYKDTIGKLNSKISNSRQK